MFSLNPAKFSLTLLFALALLLAVSSPVNANEHALHHREHANLKRLIKKRAPYPQGGGLFGGGGFLGGNGNGGVAGAGDEPPTAGDSAGSSSSSAASSSSASAQSTSSATSASITSSASSASTTGASSTVSSASSDSTSASASVSSGSSSSASSSASASSSSSVSAASSATSAAPAAETQAPANTNAAAAASASRTSQAVVTKTTTVDASESPAVEAQSASAKNKGTALTVLIAVAASVGGVAIIWTVFRKWKLGRSSKFDERLQPIDWQPKVEDDGLPGVHRSTSRSSSFHSAGHANNYNNFSDHGHGTNGLQPVPDHDFTAGSSNLAPVGGYADLARGPSPQPQMHESLARGPSFNRGYDVGVPLHHQTGYGTNDAYDYNGGAVRY